MNKNHLDQNMRVLDPAATELVDDLIDVIIYPITVSPATTPLLR